jgi:hypothetical protein
VKNQANLQKNWINYPGKSWIILRNSSAVSLSSVGFLMTCGFYGSLPQINLILIFLLKSLRGFHLCL